MSESSSAESAPGKANSWRNRRRDVAGSSRQQRPGSQTLPEVIHIYKRRVRRPPPPSLRPLPSSSFWQTERRSEADQTADAGAFFFATATGVPLASGGSCVDRPRRGRGVKHRLPSSPHFLLGLNLPLCRPGGEWGASTGQHLHLPAQGYARVGGPGGRATRPPTCRISMS